MTRKIFGFFLGRLKSAEVERKRNGCWATIPNAITIIGFGGIVYYCYLFLTDSMLWMIPFVHIGILVSDVLDGIAADRLNQHSELGRYLDPLRDRVHAIAIFTNFALVAQDEEAVIFAFGVAFAAEVWVSILAHRGLIRDVLSLGKARALIYGVSGLIGLIQLYWIGGETMLSLVVISWMMATASVTAAISYTIDART